MSICLFPPTTAPTDISHQNGTPITTEGPAMHVVIPPSAVYVRVHSRGWMLRGLGHLCTDMRPWYGVTAVFTALKSLWAPPSPFSLPAKPWQLLICFLSPQFLTSSRMS